jgi:thiol-disulfide isomerase/thioredoxin
MADMNRRRFWLTGGLAVLLCVLGLGVGVHSQQRETPKQLVVLNVPAPQIISSAADWLNTGGKPVPFARGQVYVVHFWTFGCGNCKRNLPAYAQWQKDYANSPLTIIGIHSPETAAERDPAKVASETNRLGITYPVAIDGGSANWKRWQQQWWPTVYLVDKWGNVRFYWMCELEWNGAGGTKIMQGLIDTLLREPGPAA